ncbi:hypothetical protein COS55_01335 [Candidatus Shapirobacteria bacterium CG03_land_8_20_14_0_80_40_19]|uniref:Uncharacterized protein n=3 Tax=Candidatus Shapironibacteriota TaxID=1752721 RepID=A0A2M7BET1_9BACT|nr:MAG: hypothetical protein COV89_01675 [Candidatus Shapirobacteria bacterium CG11_big_fil_rev_8_21_14_0_20_40_12]PIV01652.1 MAG: hypothetical protein COS55_01335 [Candidatus Shapirobacteria bacterium CG03_land_8_20_14_0_80_40_19]PJC76368.1 MAG: hypothetical protein CO010_02785 [Candidatus Shapirobacteria bacterium CG_4_8_14_3_um_filter_39_11]
MGSFGNKDKQPGSGRPHLRETHIHLNKEDIAASLYPCLENSERQVRISNLGLTVLMFYEYLNRMQKIGLLFGMKEEGCFKNISNLTEEGVKKIVGERGKELILNGYRFSRDQNIGQLALVVSIAALAGNPEAGVVGLERHMNWEIYRLAREAGCLTGNLNSLADLFNLVTCGAKY